jgi:hypothetical protein
MTSQTENELLTRVGQYPDGRADAAILAARVPVV